MQNTEPKSLTAVQSCQFSENSLKVQTSAYTQRCTVLSEHLLRIRYAPSGLFQPRRSWAVAKADEAFSGSLGIHNETPQFLEIGSSLVRIRIWRDNGQTEFLLPDGSSFLADLEPAVLHPLKITKQITSRERFYGFGERTGLLEKTGRRMINWATDPNHPHGPGVDPMYIAIPVVFGLTAGKAFGLFFNNTFRSEFDLTQPGKFVFKAEGGELDYYLAIGPTPHEVLEALTGLLGRMPLPPTWALGYHQSRWSYASDEQVLNLAAEFRQRNIPCDAIHLDIDHMDGYRDFTWNPTTFPDPGKMCAHLQEQGFHIVPITDAGIKVDLNYSVYQRGLEWDAFIRMPDGRLARGYVWPDDSAFFDFLRPGACELWSSLVRRQTDIGIEGLWIDMNEPVLFDQPFSKGGGGVGTLPLDALQGPANERITHAEAHNLYGSSMAQASYEGLKKNLNGRRPFVLTRSGFAGVQRWSACWMGDNDSWWEHLQMSLPQLMNMGLSGVPFVGVDIGGFGNNASPELFARWIEIGAFSPFCRGHSSIHTRQQEPWAFGPEVEEISRSYLSLRYRMLPYLYSVFWEASQTGAPIWRPLLYHFSEDPLTYDLDDQVMIGPHLMAAPILQPGRIYRIVYLPAGKWYDYWTDDLVEGPCHLLAEAPLDKLPLYVRAGAILSFGPDRQFTSQPIPPVLTLELYPGDGEFTLYEDDGQTFDYENGMSCRCTYTLRQTNGRLVFQAGAREGKYCPPERKLILRLHVHAARFEIADSIPGEVLFDPARQILQITMDDTGRAFQIAFSGEQY